MTQAISKKRWFKTNPECTARSHAPSHSNYRRGCRCQHQLDALMQRCREQETERCTGSIHAGTNTAWEKGCRHAEALYAHQESLMSMRSRRLAAVAEWERTGECAATLHGSDRAYRVGCRCPETIARWSYAQSDLPSLFGDTPRLHPFREGRMAVGKTSLLMLLHGFPDSPTMGEQIAAVAILSQRGSEVTGFNTVEAIAERLGCSDTAVARARKRIKELREQRVERRLTDARFKAERVARALEKI